MMKGNEVDQFVIIGRVKDSFGLKGELKVDAYLPASRWKKIQKVFFKRKNGPYVPFEVEKVRSHNRGSVVLKLKGIDIKEEAEKLVGAYIYLPRGMVPPKGKDEFYFFELEGLQVVTTSGHKLGKVTGVIEGRSYFLLEVDKGRGYIPFVKELVGDVNLEKGIVYVDDRLKELF